MTAAIARWRMTALAILAAPQGYTQSQRELAARFITQHGATP